MSNTMILLTSIFTLTIVALCTVYIQAMSNKKFFYGATIDKEDLKNEEVVQIHKSYKRDLYLAYILCILLGAVLIYFPKNFKDIAKLNLNMAILFLYVGYGMYRYGVANKRARYFTKSSEQSKELKIVVDTEFVNQKTKLTNRFKLLYLIPLVVAIGTAIYLYKMYPSMPDIIANHWGISGKADGFVKKSVVSVGAIVIMDILFLVFMGYMGISNMAARFKINADDIEKSKKINLMIIQKIGYTTFIMLVCFQSLITSISIAMAKNTDVNIVVMIASTLGIVAVAFYLTYIMYKYQDYTFKTKSSNKMYTVDDDDSKWVWGMIYNNPQDPAFLVPKRAGIGWTVNIGTTAGKVMIGVTILIVVCSLVLPIVLS